MKLRRFRNGDVELAFRLVGKGPLVVLLHGFPDTAETWEAAQMELAKAGYQSAALHLRGYAPSDIPESGDYSILALADDALALIDYLGVKRATIIGHDWGASAAYAAAALHPDRLCCIIALSIPPFPVFRAALRERIARPHNIYLGLGAFSEWWLRCRSFAEVARLYRKWSPHWRVPHDHITRVKLALAGPGRARAAVDFYAAKLKQSDQLAINCRITTPALVIYGSDEPQVRRKMFSRAINCLEDGSSIVCLKEVGHWPHLEAPERFLENAIEFLGKCMGSTSAT